MVYMNKVWEFIKGLVVLLYLLIILYLMLQNKQVSSQYNLSIYLIPIISFLSVIYIYYRFTILYFNVNEFEHEFTSIVNHTFRTPLTGALWFVKELEKDLPQNEKMLYLQNITNEMSKVLGIVDIFAGVKNINDISSYFFEATSLREIVEKSITKYRDEINKRKITFQISTFKDIPLLTVDLKKISFVVDTLVENAILYTPPDGRILVDCIAKKNMLTLFVSDTGFGLGMLDKMRIFSKFYRGKRAKLANTDGMGLR